MPNQSKLLSAWVWPSLFVLGSCFPLPLGGEGQRRHFKKKKEMRMLVHCRIYLAFSILMLDVCIKEIARFSSFVALPLLCLQMHRGQKKKKKNTHERCNCYAASLSAMVEPDTTFLRSSTCCLWWTEVCSEGSGRFLRSAVFLCIA